MFIGERGTQFMTKLPVFKKNKYSYLYNNMLCHFKGYLLYKMIISQNVSSGAHVEKFLFYRKVMLRSQDFQVFVFLTISQFTKSVTS